MNLVIDVAVGGFRNYGPGLARIRDEWAGIYAGADDDIPDPHGDISLAVESPFRMRSSSPLQAFITEVDDTSVVSDDTHANKPSQLSPTRDAQRALAKRLMGSIFANAALGSSPREDNGKDDTEDSVDASGNEDEGVGLTVKTVAVTAAAKAKKTRANIKRKKGVPVDILGVLAKEYDCIRQSSAPPPVSHSDDLSVTPVAGPPAERALSYTTENDTVSDATEPSASSKSRPHTDEETKGCEDAEQGAVSRNAHATAIGDDESIARNAIAAVDVSSCTDGPDSTAEPTPVSRLDGIVRRVLASCGGFDISREWHDAQLSSCNFGTEESLEPYDDLTHSCDFALPLDKTPGYCRVGKGQKTLVGGLMTTFFETWYSTYAFQFKDEAALLDVLDQGAGFVTARLKSIEGSEFVRDSIVQSVSRDEEGVLDRNTSAYPGHTKRRHSAISSSTAEFGDNSFAKRSRTESCDEDMSLGNSGVSKYTFTLPGTDDGADRTTSASSFEDHAFGSDQQFMDDEPPNYSNDASDHSGDVPGMMTDLLASPEAPSQAWQGGRGEGEPVVQGMVRVLSSGFRSPEPQTISPRDLTLRKLPSVFPDTIGAGSQASDGDEDGSDHETQHSAVKIHPAHEDGEGGSVATRTDKEGDEIQRAPTSDSSRAIRSGLPPSQHENAKSWKASKTRKKPSTAIQRNWKSSKSSRDMKASPVPAETSGMERVIGLYVPALPSIPRELVYIVGWPETYVSTLFRLIEIFTSYLTDDIICFSCVRRTYSIFFGRQNITSRSVTRYQL